MEHEFSPKTETSRHYISSHHFGGLQFCHCWPNSAEHVLQPAASQPHPGFQHPKGAGNFRQDGTAPGTGDHILEAVGKHRWQWLCDKGYEASSLANAILATCLKPQNLNYSLRPKNMSLYKLNFKPLANHEQDAEIRGWQPLRDIKVVSRS